MSDPNKSQKAALGAALYHASQARDEANAAGVWAAKALEMLPRLRELADHLESRDNAPSLDGYELADGLRAAADLLEGRPGPKVHGDCLPGSDAFQPKIALSKLRTTEVT